MAYYEYDPNYDFYYYDDDYSAELDFYMEDPSLEYRLPTKKKKRHYHRCVPNKPLVQSLSEEDLCHYRQFKSPNHLVPIFYAPTRVSDPRKLENCPIQENIDLYYSDQRNVEKEARLFRKYTQPHFYASTIQEETESSTCTFRHDYEDVLREKQLRMTKTNRKHAVEIPERWHHAGCKIHKVKKKTKTSQNLIIASNKKCNKEKEVATRSVKLETSNSWTTLQSGSCGPSRNTKTIDAEIQLMEVGSKKLTVKKSRSVISFHENPKPPVKLNVKDDSYMKILSECTKVELQAVRDTDQIPGVMVAKKPSFQSISNVQSMAAAPDNKSSSPEMVGWKNNTMQQDSSATETSKASCSPELKSNVTLPDTSEATDITINSQEYQEFLKTLAQSPMKPQQVPPTCFPSNYIQSCESITDTCGARYQVPVNSIDSNGSIYQNVNTKRYDAGRKYFKKRNPLIEAPLSISKNTLYTPTFLVTEAVGERKEEGKQCAALVQRSFFMRMLRGIVDWVASLQHYAYKYVLRFILFI